MTDAGEIARLNERITELEDRQAIRDCIVRECRARDRQDVEQIEGCWWPDGVDEHGAVVSKATEYAERANAGHRGAFRMTSHNITNHLCELTGSTASCESYVMGGLAWLDGSKTTIALGRYIDRLEKRDGQWRILVRRCTIEMTADCDPQWIEDAAIKGFLKPLWSKDDPSYERPVTWKPKETGERW